MDPNGDVVMTDANTYKTVPLRKPHYGERRKTRAKRFDFAEMFFNYKSHLERGHLPFDMATYNEMLSYFSEYENELRALYYMQWSPEQWKLLRFAEKADMLYFAPHTSLRDELQRVGIDVYLVLTKNGTEYAYSLSGGLKDYRNDLIANGIVLVK